MPCAGPGATERTRSRRRQVSAAGLHGSRTQLAALETQSDLWRRDGRALLQACTDWVTLELGVLTARRLAEQRQAPGDHLTLKLRERDRLAEAGRLLAAL